MYNRCGSEWYERGKLQDTGHSNGEWGVLDVWVASNSVASRSEKEWGIEKTVQVRILFYAYRFRMFVWTKVMQTYVSLAPNNLDYDNGSRRRFYDEWSDGGVAFCRETWFIGRAIVCKWRRRLKTGGIDDIFSVFVYLYVHLLQRVGYTVLKPKT